MTTSVPISQAKRNLSKLLHGAKQGQSYVITRYGKPIAKIVPVPQIDLASKQEAFEKLMSGL